MREKKAILIDLLNQELALIEQKAFECEQLAEQYAEEARQKRSLAESMRTTLQGLTQSFKEVSSGQPDTSESRSSSSQKSSPFTEEIIPEQQQVEDSSQKTKSERNPKEMQKPEYKGGYIAIAKQILERYPQGRHVDDLIREIFECRSEAEFERAKNSFVVELNRGVRDGRLGRLEDSEIYTPTPQETQDFFNSTQQDNEMESIPTKLLPVIKEGTEVS